MNGLKLITRIIVLFLVLLSKPSTELCISNGSVDIVNHKIENEHNHCSVVDVQKIKPNFQHNHRCCVDIKLSETLGNIATNFKMFDFQCKGLHVETQNYFIVLNNHFSLWSRYFQTNFKTFSNAYIDHIPNYPSFQFTSTVVLLI